MAGEMKARGGPRLHLKAWVIVVLLAAEALFMLAQAWRH
jgi:hypothetical protein